MKYTWTKLLGSILLSSLLVSGCGTNNDDAEPTNNQITEAGEESEEPVGLPEMTEKDITLTYAAWENQALQQYMADQFMEKYPNITVELVTVDQEVWNDGLSNLASAGNLPDVYWYQGNVDVPIINGWLGDLTEYWEADPESDDVLVSLQDKGYINGENKFAAAVFYQPYTVFLDENLFEAQNVPMPSADWTYSEMIDLMQEMTIPEQGIFGYNTFTQLVTMAPIVQGDADGEFGWDGESFDLTEHWDDAMAQHAEFVRSGVHVPFFDTDEAEAAFGDRLLWSASSGRLAIQLDAWWTKDLFATDEFVDKGINWVPYPVPKGDNAETEYKPGFVDFGSISSVTEYPREAYELLKFMGWGSEGWETRLEAYRTLTNEDGSRIFPTVDGLPLVNDQSLWDQVAAEVPDNQYYADYLERVKEPVPLGGAVIPGFQTWLEEVYFGGEYGNVEQASINGELNPADVAADLTEKLNEYHQEALDEIF